MNTTPSHSKRAWKRQLKHSTPLPRVIPLHQLVDFYNALCQTRHSVGKRGTNAYWRNPFADDRKPIGMGRSVSHHPSYYVYSEILPDLDQAGIDRDIFRYWFVYGRVPDSVRQLVAERQALQSYSQKQ